MLGGAEMLTSDGVSTVMYASALTDPLPDPELPVSSSRIIWFSKVRQNFKKIQKKKKKGMKKETGVWERNVQYLVRLENYVHPSCIFNPCL